MKAVGRRPQALRPSSLEMAAEHPSCLLVYVDPPDAEIHGRVILSGLCSADDGSRGGRHDGTVRDEASDHVGRARDACVLLDRRPLDEGCAVVLI